MKKRVLTIIFSISLVINVFAIAVIATNGEEIIQAVLNKNIRLTWNGVEFQPVDPVTGQRVYPIVYGDRTYIPARFIAEKSGVAVDWDSNTQTVSFEAKYNAINGEPWKDSQSYGNTAPATAAPAVPSISSQEVVFGKNMNMHKLLEGRNDGIRIYNTEDLNGDGSMKLDSTTIGGDTAYDGYVMFAANYDDDHSVQARAMSKLFSDMKDMLRAQGWSMKYGSITDITIWTKGNEQFVLNESGEFINYYTDWMME